MVLSIPGGEFLTGSLDVISQSLTIPVLVILLVIVIITIITLGGAISEYTSRKKVPVGVIRDLIYDINASQSVDELKSVISNADIPKSQKKVLTEIASSESLGDSSREALARKLFEFEEEKTIESLRKTDIITRLGPTIGLMGTLIPMGPGLAALGAGDINTLASSLTVAFNTTIVGIGSSALCYFIGKLRSSWYDRYLSDLDALISGFMVRKNGRRRSKRVEEDPMTGIANLVDAMLVIAVGFLVFVIISWNMQAMIDPDQSMQEAMQQQTTEVDQGQQLNETPDTSNSSGQGYTEMGKVYKDPATGKLIMVEG